MRRVRAGVSWRRLVRVGAVLALGVAVVAVASIGWVRVRANGHEYTVESVPAADVGIVLGAQVYDNGEPSPYLARRLDIGRGLLESGKVKALLLSGDHGRWSYDEPNAMRRYLIQHGVPSNKLAVDYAGFDTYQSCVRAKQIFGVNEAIVVTQDFSAPRTAALCESAGVRTSVVSDTTQPHNGIYWKCWLRDQLAATKAAYAMLTHPDPKFLGDQETTVRDAIAAPLP